MKTKFFIIVFILALGNIKAQDMAGITPPVYPGCEEQALKMQCMREQILKLVSENFNPQVLNGIEKRPVIVETAFTITHEGKIEINEVKTGNESLRMEIFKVLSKIPPVKPAEKDGIPIAIQYKIPLVFQ